MTALHGLSAAELAALYRAGAVSPSDALAACLARHDQVNPALNAVVALNREGAKEAARTSDARFIAGKPLSPLDGVPVTIKDNLKLAGLPATWGSRAYVDHWPKRDELAVARLRHAGAVLIGKTNTPELSLAGFTSNDVFGSTGNPWDPTLTPGGSSGGAVAGLMSGIAPLALATDAGGSIRRPAGYTGACGLRTTPGLVARRGGFPGLANDLQTIGPLARTIEDLALMLDILAPDTGRSVMDEVSPDPSSRAPLHGRRIGLIGRIDDNPVDPEILDRLTRTAESLRQLGAVVDEIATPFDPAEVGALFMDLAAAGVVSVLEEKLAAGFTPTAGVARLAEAGRQITGAAYIRTLARVAAFRWQMADLFETLNYLLSPSIATLPWPRDEPFPETIDGVAASPRASAIYTGFVNVAGLPALAFPAEVSENGLPIGMQLVGPAGSDRRLLEAGRLIETYTPWPRLAPMM